MKTVNRSFRFFVAAVVIFVLSSCTQYQVVAQRAASYTGHIERLSVWSAIGAIDLLGEKRGAEKLAFSDRLDKALKLGFQDERIQVEVFDFNPKSHVRERFEDSEQQLRPDARLFVQPTRFQTLTSSRGGSMVSGLWLDLNLVEVNGNRQIWHASLFVDPGLDPTAWFDNGAEKLARQVIDALKKDKVIQGQSAAS